VRWDFHGILGDLVGDLVLTPDPIEVKIFSPDLPWLEKAAAHVEQVIRSVSGVVDTFNGLTETGPSIVLHVRQIDASRFGLTSNDISAALNTALLGQVASHVQEGDRIVNIRVLLRRKDVASVEALRNLVIRSPGGARVRVSQVADVVEEPGHVELDREDLRQNVAVTGRLEGRDLGSAMAEIRSKLASDNAIPPDRSNMGAFISSSRSRSLIFSSCS